jgi:hemolysin III
MSTIDQATEFPFGMYSEAEERANRLTHGLGFVLSVLGTIYLVSVALARSDVPRLLACSVYAASLMSVYAMSTLSHGPFAGRWRDFFRSLDQGFIYFLIAGSATPWAVAYLPGPVCWSLLGAMWTIAVGGFIGKVWFAHRIDAVSVWVYVAMGWLPILATPWFVSVAPSLVLWSGLGAGLCYTTGTFFLIFDRRVPHFHAVWHLFVMAGSALHFFGTLSLAQAG